MKINTSSQPIEGFQTTDGGFVYRRVTPTRVETSSDGTAATVPGLMTLEQRASSDKSGETRILFRVKIPYCSVVETKCCGSENTSIDVSPAGSITSHLVLTLSKKVIKDLQGPNAGFAANQILAAVGLNLGTSNLFAHGGTAADRGSLAKMKGGVLQIDGDDVHGALDPSCALTRAILGVTPIPQEGFYSVDRINTMNVTV